MAKNEVPYHGKTPKFGRMGATNSAAVALTTLITAGADDMKVKTLMASLGLINNRFDSDSDAVVFEISVNDGADKVIARVMVSNETIEVTRTESLAAYSSMETEYHPFFSGANNPYYADANSKDAFDITREIDYDAQVKTITETKNLGAGLKHGMLDILSIITGGGGFNLAAGQILKGEIKIVGSPNHTNSNLFAVGEDY